MAIPDFDANGFLPEGVHACTLEDVGLRFGRFHGTDRRPRLFARLEELWRELSQSPVVAGLIINGSFVTENLAPNDVDVLIVLKRQHDWETELNPSDYALLSHNHFRRRFGFDVLVAEEDSALYWKYVSFYSQSRELPHARKGVLRIEP